MTKLKRSELQPLVARFLSLPESEKAQCLARFIFEMTIALRDVYSDGPDRALASFKAWNELLHRVSATLDRMLAGSSERYPDDVLMKLVEGSAEQGLQRVVVWVLNQSLEHLPRKSMPARKSARVH